jgi:hypothetical protein
MDDLTKVGAGGGFGAAVAAAVAWFSRAATAGRLDAMQAQLSELNAKLTILVASTERHIHDEERLDAARRLAALEAHVAQIQRTLDQVVQS